MILPPRTLLIRLVFSAAVLAWAVYKLRALDSGAVTGVSLLEVSPVDTPLTPSAAPAVPTGEPDPMVDPEAAVEAMEAALSATAGCGVRGTLAIELGPPGLVSAEVRGLAVDADAVVAEATRCAADIVWATRWPRTAVRFDLEGALR